MGITLKDIQQQCIDRLGETKLNYQGCEMKIIRYCNSRDIDILFDGKIIRKNLKYDDFKSGVLKNLYHPNVYNKGFVGDGIYKGCNGTDYEIKRYKFWNSMIERGYSDVYKAKQPTYKNCTVCEEWLNYQVFAKWVDKNYYEIDSRRMQLDKDIIVKGSTVYSPETCVFVPIDINCLFTKRQNLRGKYLIGVSKDKSKFRSTFTKNTKQVYLGLFETEIEAYLAYKTAKEDYIKQVANDYKSKYSNFPERLYTAMYNYSVDITD